MINLLRYRDRAAYAKDSGAEPCSGREAYGRYGQVSIRLITAVAREASRGCSRRCSGAGLAGRFVSVLGTALNCARRARSRCRR